MPVKKLGRSVPAEVPSPGLSGGGMPDLGGLGIPDIISGIGSLTAGPALARLEAAKLGYMERMSEKEHLRAIEKIKEAAKAGGEQDRQTMERSAQLNTPSGQQLSEAQALGIDTSSPREALVRLFEVKQEMSEKAGQQLIENLKNVNTPEGRKAKTAAIYNLTTAEVATNLGRASAQFITTQQQAGVPISEIFHNYKGILERSMAQESAREAGLLALLRSSMGTVARTLRGYTPGDLQAVVGTEEVVTGAPVQTAPPPGPHPKTGGSSWGSYKGARKDTSPPGGTAPAVPLPSKSDQVSVKVKNWGPGNFPPDLIDRAVDKLNLPADVASDTKDYLKAFHGRGEGVPKPGDPVSGSRAITVWGPRKLDKVRTTLEAIAAVSARASDTSFSPVKLAEQTGMSAQAYQEVVKELPDLTPEATEFAGLLTHLTAPALDSIADLPSAGQVERWSLEKVGAKMTKAGELPPDDVAKATMAESVLALISQSQTSMELAFHDLGSPETVDLFRTKLLNVTSGSPELQEVILKQAETTDTIRAAKTVQPLFDKVLEYRDSKIKSAWDTAAQEMAKVDTEAEAAGFANLEELARKITDLSGAGELNPQQQEELAKWVGTYQEIQGAKVPGYSDMLEDIGDGVDGPPPKTTPATTTQPAPPTKPTKGVKNLTLLKTTLPEDPNVLGVNAKPPEESQESALAQPERQSPVDYSQLSNKSTAKLAAYQEALKARPVRNDEFLDNYQKFSLAGAAKDRSRLAKSMLDRSGNSLPQNIPPGGVPVASAQQGSQTPASQPSAPKQALGGGLVSAQKSLEAMEPQPGPSANVMAVSQANGFPNQLSRTPTADRLRNAV